VAKPGGNGQSGDKNQNVLIVPTLFPYRVSASASAALNSFGPSARGIDPTLTVLPNSFDRQKTECRDSRKVVVTGERSLLEFFHPVGSILSLLS